jgi:2-amino-4-hydroxy-6-hydroxymethyldihydropteridine diphosphokinase
VSLSLGSNSDPQRVLRLALDALELHFGELRLSPVFESEPVGFVGPNFLNLVVCFETVVPLRDLAASLKALEEAHGRLPDAPRYSGRTLDIDILCYGELLGVHEGILLPRAEILHNAYVLWPLSLLLPEHRHPLNQQTFAQLWRDYDKGRQALWPADFTRCAPPA